MFEIDFFTGMKAQISEIYEIFVQLNVFVVVASGREMIYAMVSKIMPA